jgi:hypothetical protein
VFEIGFAQQIIDLMIVTNVLACFKAQNELSITQES